MRDRVFFFIGDGVVHRTTAVLPRWKCPACRASFTEYPDYAIPRKRFVRRAVESLCRQYLEGGSASYRKAVSEDGLPIFYPEGETALPPRDVGNDNTDRDDPVPTLSHTAVYRWITTLGGQAEPAAADGAKGATAPPRIPSRKFRSRRRQQILLTCMHLLEIPKPRR